MYIKAYLYKLFFYYNNKKDKAKSFSLQNLYINAVCRKLYKGSIFALNVHIDGHRVNKNCII